MKNIVILISGRGSNMEALIAARDAGNLPVNIVAVISNRPDAAGLETAARAGIEPGDVIIGLPSFFQLIAVGVVLILAVYLNERRSREQS